MPWLCHYAHAQLQHQQHTASMVHKHTSKTYYCTAQRQCCSSAINTCAHPFPGQQPAAELFTAWDAMSFMCTPCAPTHFLQERRNRVPAVGSVSACDQNTSQHLFFCCLCSAWRAQLQLSRTLNQICVRMSLYAVTALCSTQRPVPSAAESCSLIRQGHIQAAPAGQHR